MLVLAAVRFSKQGSMLPRQDSDLEEAGLKVLITVSTSPVLG